MPTIGEKIREVRTKRGLTQSDLSAGIVTPSMISQIEADRARPSYTLLTGLANRLGMPVEYFMNEMDEKFTVTTWLGVANYYVLTEQFELALETLARTPLQEQPGSNFQDYLLLKAICQRRLGKHQDAVACLEHLREMAYRTQDAFLQFQVCKESGYVEYDLNNDVGAMHEWKKAIHLGETLAESGLVPSVSIHSKMLDVLVRMDEIEKRSEKSSETESSNYLIQAGDLAKLFINFRTIGETLIEEAKTFVTIDVSRAKSLTERAISLIDSSRLIEQYIFIQVKLHHDDAAHAIDPWTHAAFATTSVNPTSFIEAECERIEYYLKTKDMHAAERRINRCFEILEDYDKELNQPSQLREIEWKLYTYRARVIKAAGQTLEAIEALTILTHKLDSKRQTLLLIKTWAQLVAWYGEMNDHESVFRLTKKIETIMEHVSVPQFSKA